ncbi:hypothetical protein BJ138DRAFT_39342 [Hygrophoropsis aurantiaca]|uniref:Uncharacterized protein n=1 Tax=Hygrophoropsis aurantiaca TaxID=72124 RepID=A0ACB8ACG8_9AGAM|nr:hypothetical protein BJ138DRAFT_39342 [Hygrophoropsis aurantiaca]
MIRWMLADSVIVRKIVDTEDSATHQDDDDAVSQSQEIHSEAVDDLHQDAQADVVPPAADDHHVGGSDDHNAVDPGASENNAQPMSQPPVDDDMEASGIINTASSDVDNTTPPRPSTPRQQHPYPMPVSADPTVPDPIGSSFMSPKASQQSPPPKANHQTPPRLIKIPGTPHLVLSPSNTPGLPTPTPVAIPVTASMLEVLSRGVSVSATDVMGSGSGSGLFTPRNGEDASAASSASGNDNEAEQEKADDGLATGVNEGLNGSVGVAAAEEATDVPQHAVRSSSEPNIIEEETPIEAEKGDEIVPDREDDEKIADRNRDVSPTPEREEVLTKPSSIDEYAGIDKHPNVNDDNEPVESQDQITDAVEVEADNLPEDSTSVAQCIADAQPVEVAEDTIQASDNPQQEEAAEHISNQSTPQLGYPDDPPSPQGPLVVDDPLKLRVTTSTAASDLQSHNPILPASDDGPSNSPADIMQSFTNVPTSAETERRSLSVDPPREPSPAEDQSNDREFVVADLKPLKRKRVSSLAKPSRIPRSKSLNTAKTVSSLKSKSKGKGKADAHDQGDVHDSSHKDNNSEYGSTSSSASVASKLLIGPGSNASRASSVFSNAPSDSLSVGHAFTPPLFHAHGNLHHHHGHRPLPPPVPPRPQPIVRAASSPQPSPEEKEPAPAVTGTPSSSIRPVVSSNSPVTRSNCRFHKISLPKEEGGPRVCFVVPGCSLGDKTLMDDEEIQDHGPATYDDYARLLGNIESLDFNSYLIGVLRQLVGVDLLRENEVFYLLQPGEEFHYKKLGRKASAIAKRVTRESSSAMARSGSPVYSSVMRSPASSLRPPVSAGGSISTSIGSSRSRARASRTESHSLCSASDGETVAQDEDGTRKLKRRRKGSIAPESSTISAGASSSQQAPEKKATSSNRGLMRRRSKRLGKDNAAFQPDSGDGEDSADEEASPKSRRKSRQKNRGTKRPRVQENEGEVNSESQSKKRRNHDAEE